MSMTISMFTRESRATPPHQRQVLTGTIMRNWQMDGWTESDWDTITECADGLQSIARELDNAVGGGGGGFEPAELAAASDRLQGIAERLKRISGAYL